MWCCVCLQTLCSLGTLGQAIDSGRFMDATTHDADLQAILLTVRRPAGRRRPAQCMHGVVAALPGCLMSHRFISASASSPTSRVFGSMCVCAWCLQALEIASALCYLHRVGVVHADLNGNNILLK